MNPLDEESRRIHGGNRWVWMRERGFAMDDVIDFSADVNPLGFPDCVRSVIEANVESIRHYPDPDAVALREAIAEFHSIPMECVLPANGSAELITLLVQFRFFQRGVVFGPTFTEYAWVARQRQATVIDVLAKEDAGFQFPGISLHKTPKPEVVFLCNPNNPTGQLISKTRVLELAQWCEKIGAYLVLDEAFIDFVEPSDGISLVSEAARFDSVVVLRSLTKSFAIPGLRLGYLVGSETIVQRLRALQTPWPLNTFALLVGTRLLQENDWLSHTRQQIAHLRQRLCQSLETIPDLKVFPSVTNFLLCKLRSLDRSASELTCDLAQQGLLIRCCDDFVGLETGRFIRIAVRTQKENERLVQVLRNIMEGRIANSR